MVVKHSIKICKFLIIFYFAIMLISCVGGNNVGNDNPNINADSMTNKDKKVTIQWFIDGEDISQIDVIKNLHDMGWHIITARVKAVSHYFSPSFFDGIHAQVKHGIYGENVTIQDINCNNAVFAQVGDNCSAYIKIGYNYESSYVESATVDVSLYSGNLLAFPAIASLEDKIVVNDGSIGDYRVVEDIESQYYVGSLVAQNPSQYQMLLMQNGSLESIAIENISPLNNAAFTLMQRSESDGNDPYYGHWSQCALSTNHDLNQVANLKHLNDSCLLIYQAESLESSAIEAAIINVVTNAQNTFPFAVNNYALLATYTIPPATFTIQQTTLPESQAWSSVTYGESTFVTVSSGEYSSNLAAYSTDGINWQSTTLPERAYWSAVTYGNGAFVAIAMQESLAAYSTDGINWQSTTLPESAFWSAVTYGESKFVAVSSGMSNKFIYSSDGINWESTTVGSPEAWDSVAYGNGTFVAISQINNVAAYSSDGINWTLTALPNSNNWLAVSYGDNAFVTVGSSTGTYSNDGINWQSINMPTNQTWYAIAYGDGVFIAIGYNNSWAYSLDGINWQTINPPNQQNWSAITYGDNQFVVTSGSAYNSYTYNNAAAVISLQINPGPLSSFVMTQN